MDDAGYVESGLHGEIITSATAYFLIITHDASLGLPELNALLSAGFPYLHTHFTHIRYWRIGPITVTTYKHRHLFYVAQVGFRTVFGKESVDFITPLPVGLMRSQHTAVIARLIDEDLRIHLFLHQGLAQFSYHPGHLTVGSRTSLLLRSRPVPMSIGFVDRTHIVDVDTVVLLNPLERSGDKLSKLLIAVVFQVDGSSPSGIRGESILRIKDGSRIAESQQIRNSSLLGEFQEASLPRLLIPVVGSIGIQKALGSGSSLNLRSLSLFLASCAQIESPERQTNSLRFPRLIIFHGKQPVCYLLLLLFWPETEKLHTPRITCAKVLDMLLWRSRKNGKMNRLSLRRQERKAERNGCHQAF